ncbi:MAG TPA: hypothetical protein VMP11_01655 [Verrucomicrobiae bacterium]|nr:hypothetical protein [Verrucomicrobiae bacterium]
MPTNIQRWHRRALQMMKCKTAATLIKRYGQPSHKVQCDQFEIWHHPLGVDDGTLYTVHVCVPTNQSARACLHMDPSTLPDTPQPPWWKFWNSL